MNQQRNNDIRKTAKEAGVRFWQIAESLGEAESALSRRLRHELNAEDKQKILNVIQELKE